MQATHILGEIPADNRESIIRQAYEADRPPIDIAVEGSMRDVSRFFKGFRHVKDVPAGKVIAFILENENWARPEVASGILQSWAADPAVLSSSFLYGSLGIPAGLYGKLPSHALAEEPKYPQGVFGPPPFSPLSPFLNPGNPAMWGRKISRIAGRAAGGIFRKYPDNHLWISWYLDGEK